MRPLLTTRTVQHWTLLIVAYFSVLSAAAQAIPSPESHFGHAMGVDRQLLDWDRVVSYFQLLAKSSNQIEVKELGKTAEGRPFILATITSPENMRNLNRYLEIQRKLADPRLTTSAEAARLALQGKTVVLITCSIHATEVGSTHTAVEFAYRLLTEDRPKYRAILNDVILLLIPSLNPDGVDIVTRWYRRTLGTPFEGTSPPELYQKYVGHDNNRDWYVFSQPETQLTISQVQNVWHPQIVYDVHQQGAYASRMFVPPWLDPIDPNIDAIIAQENNAVGAGMAADLTAAGKKGVAINAMYDLWSPSRHYQCYHGGLRVLSESASANLASPITVTPAQIAETALGYNPRERSWNYLEPWEGGTWHLRDIIDYQLVAWESCLYQAAVRREDLLRNFYEAGKRSIARSAPYAFVIPKQQFDPGATRKMLELLSFGMVEVEQATAAFQAQGKDYAVGSYVIRMQQPYSGYAKTLLERQHYPDLRQYPGGPPKQPYDVTAQTLPLLMGADVQTVASRFEVPLQRAANFSFELEPRAEAGSLAASDVDSWRTVNETWNAGGKVWRDATTGAFFTSAPGQSGSAVLLNRPRVALYKSYRPAMDEGWTRWLLENFKFTYENVLNPDISAGNLRQRFDAIVFPDESAREITEGYRKGTMPEQYVGGLDEKAVAKLREFAEAGGTLVFLNEACDFAVDKLGVALKNVIHGVPNRDFYSPGSLLNVQLTAHNPVTYGMPNEIAIWSEQSPAWDVPANSADVVLARYPAGNVLASGWLLGERYLVNRAALVDAPLGKGRAILFGMRPQYRAQSYQTFKMFFNALVLNVSR